MSSPLVLAYSGSLEASAAIPWLAETCGADVVTLTLDIGQEQPVEQIRARALACGAVRAHVVDAREEFARECVVSALRRTPPGRPLPLSDLAHPLIARRLVECAAAEAATAVAHASVDEVFHDGIAALAPSLRVIAPAREWAMDAAQVAAYARVRGLPHVLPAVASPVDHLLVRRVWNPAASPDGEARLELTFHHDVPVALNGVEMSAAELVESVSLIGGHYGLGWAEPVPVPAVPVLQAAYAALRDPAGVVTVKVSRGVHAVLASEPLVTVA